jgi:hypothetical protein
VGSSVFTLHVTAEAPVEYPGLVGLSVELDADNEIGVSEQRITAVGMADDAVFANGFEAP